MKRTIKSIKVIRPGSNPDVDSDFHTRHRMEAIDYVTEKYGKPNVSSIITFTKNGAKGAFKKACTIYEIPFAEANRIASLVPDPVEGQDITLEEMFDPEHDRYNEGAAFREAVSVSEWDDIMACAKRLSGKFTGTGIHACGIIISSQPLAETIPLMTDQRKDRIATQWTYQECEALGLIKMDFLGLDTVDILQRTVEYTMENGVEDPPNLTTLVQGAMDDKATYRVFQEGRTSGIFQFGSDMVKNLLLSMKPTEFNDLAATTAVARPGPMEVDAHNEYARRKNGRSEIVQMHQEFEGTDVEEILSETYGLLIYQEQVMHIANRVAGMTLQQADDLRSAMGKKKKAVMDKMRPIFFEGALANGFSEEAVTVLWDTCAAFAKYAFNKSHSVAYAMNAYSAAYLKANYPVEFMSSLIAQNTGDKKKTLEFLKESNSMGLKIGSVDINLSDVLVAPDFKKESGKDILFGISGIKAVSEKMAEIIVQERKTNGRYSSVKDLVDRCTPLGVSSRTVYENLAFAGAFDSFGASRKSVVEFITALIGDAKTKEAKGDSLFDMFEDEIDDVELDLDGLDYGFVDKLRREADVIGLYLTDHPLSVISKETNVTKSPIMSMLSSKRRTSVKFMASVTKIDEKKPKGNRPKAILLDLDDGLGGYFTARMSGDLVKGLDKGAAQATIRSAYEKGKNEMENDILRKATNQEIRAIPAIEANSIYYITVNFSPGRDGQPYRAQIESIKKIQTTHEGGLPVRIRFIEDQQTPLPQLQKLERSLAYNLDKKIPGDSPIFISKISKLYKVNDQEYLYAEAVREMMRSADQKEVEEVYEGSRKRRAKKKVATREWPPSVDASEFEIEVTTKDEELEALDNLEYLDTGFRTEKSVHVQQVIEKFLGERNYDFGVFNPRILEEEF